MSSINNSKKTLFLSLPYLGEIPLQTRTKSRKSLKGLLNSCKLKIASKSQRKASNVCRFKDRLPSDLVSGVVYKYTCSRCNYTYYGETDRHLKVRSGERIRTSPLTFKKVKPSKEIAIHDHLLNWINIPSFEEFTILTNGNAKFVLKSKKVYLSNKIDLFWIKTLVLLNCFLLTIVSFLIVSLSNNIVWL